MTRPDHALADHVRAADTRTLVTALATLGDPAPGTAERLAMLFVADELEARHDLHDLIEEIIEERFDDITYGEAVLAAYATRHPAF